MTWRRNAGARPGTPRIGLAVAPNRFNPVRSRTRAAGNANMIRPVSNEGASPRAEEPTPFAACLRPARAFLIRANSSRDGNAVALRVIEQTPDNQARPPETSRAPITRTGDSMPRLQPCLFAVPSRLLRTSPRRRSEQWITRWKR